MQDGFPVFVAPDAARFGPKEVEQALEQEYRDELENCAGSFGKQS